MSGVKRYGPTCDCMSEMDWGDYVLASDYETLRTELAVSRQWEALLNQPEWVAVQVLKNTIDAKDADIGHLRTANQRLEERLLMARRAMAAVLAQEKIKAVAKRVLADEIARIDAALAGTGEQQ